MNLLTRGVTVVVLACSALQSAAQEGKAPAAEKAVEIPGAVEIRFVDDSAMKAQLQEDRLTLETRFGKLLIPIAEIQRIDFGLRISADQRQRIDAAVADLGHKEFQKRQKASSDLLALKEKAYAALQQAAKGSDSEIVRRVEQLLEKLRDSIPAEQLETPLHDVVHTADSKIAGLIMSDVLRVSTLPFGVQQVKLTDMRSLNTPRLAGPDNATNALPDPGVLGELQGNIGQTFSFRVTAPPAAFLARIGVFGTDVYTTDSALAGAAVHAGVLQPGQTGIVRATLVGPQPAFQPSVRNGVQSHAYGPWTGFRVEQPRGRAAN